MALTLAIQAAAGDTIGGRLGNVGYGLLIVVGLLVVGSALLAVVSSGSVKGAVMLMVMALAVEIGAYVLFGRDAPGFVHLIVAVLIGVSIWTMHEGQ